MTTSTTTRQIPFLALALTLLAACSSPNSQVPGQGDVADFNAPTEASRAPGYPGDPAVEACLLLLDVRSRQDGRVLRTDFILRNGSEGTLAGSWAVAWATADGSPVGTPLTWSPISLAPGAARSLSITAPSADAVSWTLHAVGLDAAPSHN